MHEGDRHCWGEGAVLVTHGDAVFATTYSDDAQLGRVEIRNLVLQGNLDRKMQDRGSEAI